VSTGPQEDGYSLDEQHKDGLAKAGLMGWNVRPENVHRETDSGVDIFGRPELTKIRRKVESGHVQAVIYPEVDRFARDPAWLELLVREHWHFGARVAFARGSDELASNTPEAYLLRQVQGYGAQNELQQLKQRIRRGKAARLDAGRLTPCSLGPLYGYRFADADQPDPGKRHVATKVRYEVYEPEAQAVRNVFAWAAEGRTIRWITRQLTRQGVPAPRGPVWAHSTVCKILNETAYYGEGFANRFALANVLVSGRLVRRHVPRPREQWLRYPELTADGKYPVIPPIIDKPTFVLAMQARSLNRASSARRAGDPEAFLLRGGFVVCGTCGGSMYGTHSNTPHPYYVCSSYRHGEHLPPEWQARTKKPSIRAHAIDSAVWRRLEDLLNKSEQPRCADLPTETGRVRDARSPCN
jgi:site-specific DNA recombinase